MTSGLGNAGAVLGGVASVLGAGAALIDALPDSAPSVLGEAPAVSEAPSSPPPRAPSSRRAMQQSPGSALRAAGDAKMAECRALMAESRNAEARDCFASVKSVYDDANAADDIASQTPVRKAVLRSDGRTRGKVPEGCLVVRDAVPAGVGCAAGKEWFWTPVAVKKGAHCPAFFKVRYTDPATGKATDAEEFPGRLQTCGAGVTQAWIDQ